MAERKLYTYAPESEEGVKWYKKSINGEVYDLLPEKHKSWFVCITDRDTQDRIPTFNLNEQQDNILLPRENTTLANSMEIHRSVHIYSSSASIVSVIEILGLRTRYGMGTSIYPDFTYRHGHGGLVLVSINSSWYRVDQLNRIIIEVGINGRDLTNQERAALEVNRSRGNTLLSDRDLRILEQARINREVTPVPTNIAEF